MCIRAIDSSKMGLGLTCTFPREEKRERFLECILTLDHIQEPNWRKRIENRALTGTCKGVAQENPSLICRVQSPKSPGGQENSRNLSSPMTLSALIVKYVIVSFILSLLDTEQSLFFKMFPLAGVRKSRQIQGQTESKGEK